MSRTKLEERSSSAQIQTEGLTAMREGYWGVSDEGEVRAGVRDEAEVGVRELLLPL